MSTRSFRWSLILLSLLAILSAVFFLGLPLQGSLPPAQAQPYPQSDLAPLRETPTLIASFYVDQLTGLREIWDLQTIPDSGSAPFVSLSNRDEIDLYSAPPGVQMTDPVGSTAFSCDQVSEIPRDECQALVILYNSTNGSGWKDRAGWLTTNTPCSWYGMTCQDGHVTSLVLESNQMQGVLPTQLANLRSLKTLNLWRNQLTGSIPREFESLDNLQELILSWNELGGDIPPELGNLSRLKKLVLQINRLTGTIPLQFCNLRGLENLDLTDNQLQGEIPSCLGDLTNLTWLSIFKNQLTGGIPRELGNLTRLTFINLQSNQLTGGIPPEFGNLINLRMLFLHYNQLSGPIPSQLGNLTKLEQLSLNGNRLTGAIPPEFGNLQKIEWLMLDVNRLGGAIPAELGNLASVYQLTLGRNALSGEIPSTITRLTNLDMPPWPGLPAWSEIQYNALSASDPAVVDFLNSKLPGWSTTQTIAPTGLSAVANAGSVDLNWNLIPYTQHGGYYEIGLAMAPEGPYSIVGRTSDKNTSSYRVGNLLFGRTYYFVVRTYTPSHDAQQNDLLSSWSQEVSAVSTDDHTITGRVTDTSGHGIPGVTVWAGFPRNTTTDASGNYTFTDLPAGTYTIRPDKKPCTFTPTTQTVTIPPGKALPDFTSVRLASGLDVCILEPGDILLKAGAPVGDYTDLIRFWIKLGGSYFTHSALYLGATSDPQNPAQTGPRIAEAAGKKKLGGSREDEVWETWLADTQWWDGENVTDWAVVRPVASSEAKTIAIQYARDKAVDPDVVFDFLANLDDEQKFYCSKLVWKSYQQAGLDVHKKTGLTGDLTSYWVTPEDLYFGSPVVQNMPGVDPSTRAFFRIYSPAHITLIDPLGRRTGFDSSSGGEVNEIPGALYSGADAQIESITLAGLGSSEGWRLLTTGYASGTYTLETGYFDGRTRNWETHATTSEGKVDEFPVHPPDYPTYLPLLMR